MLAPDPVQAAQRFADAMRGGRPEHVAAIRSFTPAAPWYALDALHQIAAASCRALATPSIQGAERQQTELLYVQVAGLVRLLDDAVGQYAERR